MHSVIIILLAFFSSNSVLASHENSGTTSKAFPPVIQLQKDILVVGSEQDYPPFATGMTDATAGGFTVELWKAVADEAGLKYTIRVLPFHQLLQEFKDGNIDVLINLAQSEERHHFADFTVPHVVVKGAIFVRKGDTNIRTEEDLAGKSTIVLNADLAHDYAVSKGWGKQLVLADTSADGMRLLASGKHDVMLLGKLAGMQTLQELGLDNIEAMKVKIGFSQKFAFAVAEGQSELLGRINEGFAYTKSNGTYDELYNKWFGIYETKEVGLHEVLKYIIPIVAIFIAIAGYFVYRRHVERERAAAELLASRNLLTTIIDTAPIRVFWKDRELRYLGCNTIFAKDGGKTHPSEVIGKDDYQMGWSAQADLYRADDRAVMESDNPKLNYEEYQTTPTGGLIWLRTSKVPLKNVDGESIGLLGIYEDITEQKHAQEQIHTMLREQKAMLENDLVGIVKVINRVVVWANPAFEKMMGYGAGELVGTPTRRNYVSEEDYNALGSAAYPILHEGGIYRTQIEHLRHDGGVIWVDMSGAMLNLATDESLWVFIDISLHKLAEEQIQQFAFYDALTQLPNRRLLSDRLKQSMSTSKRSGCYGALLFIDLDNFKPLNDTHGHGVGDLLLIDAANRLKSCVREMDTVARFGGDEFVVMLSELNTDKTESSTQARSVAEKILSTLSEPYLLTICHNGKTDTVIEHRCTASIGVVMFINHESSQEDILEWADAAMYQAKEAGRNQIRFYVTRA